MDLVGARLIVTLFLLHYLQAVLKHIEDILLHRSLRLSLAIHNPASQVLPSRLPGRLAQATLHLAVIAREEHGLAIHAQPDRGLESGGCGGTLKVKETRKEHDNGLRIVSVLELLQLGLDVGRRVLTRFENHALRLHAAVEPARRLQLRFLHN